MPLREEFLEYPDGVRIRLRVNEHNNRKTALFIHGWGERLEFYDYLYPYFETNDIALNMIELRGHGESGGRPVLHDISPYLKDIKRVIYGNLRNSVDTVIGSGFGGLLTLCAAHDERLNIGSLVLISPVLKLKLTPLNEMVCVLLASISAKIKTGLAGEYWPCQTDDDEAFEALMKNNTKPFEIATTGLVAMLHREVRLLCKNTGWAANRAVLTVLNEEDLFLDIAGCEQILHALFGGNNFFKIARCNRGSAALLTKSRVDHLEKIISWVKQSAR